MAGRPHLPAEPVTTPTGRAHAPVIRVRMTARLALTRPAIAQVLLLCQLSYASEQEASRRGLCATFAPASKMAGWVEDPGLDLIPTAGSVLLFRQMALDHPDELDESAGD